MSEGCRFYSLLLPISLHESLRRISKERDIPIANLVKAAIKEFLGSPKTECRKSEVKDDN